MIPIDEGKWSILSTNSLFFVIDSVTQGEQEKPPTWCIHFVIMKNYTFFHKMLFIFHVKYFNFAHLMNPFNHH